MQCVRSGSLLEALAAAPRRGALPELTGPPPEVSRRLSRSSTWPFPRVRHCPHGLKSKSMSLSRPNPLSGQEEGSANKGRAQGEEAETPERRPDLAHCSPSHERNPRSPQVRGLRQPPARCRQRLQATNRVRRDPNGEWTKFWCQVPPPPPFEVQRSPRISTQTTPLSTAFCV